MGIRTIKIALLIIIFMMTFQNRAAEKTLTLKATVPAVIDITKENGTELPSEIEIKYNSRVGLEKTTLKVKVWVNKKKNIEAKIASDVELKGKPDGFTTEIAVPMTVKLDDKVLTAKSNILFDQSLFFPASGAQTGLGSKVMNLEVSQTKAERLLSGTYTGKVTLVLTVAT